MGPLSHLKCCIGRKPEQNKRIWGIGALESKVVRMTGTIAAAIADEQVLEPNSLVGLTRNFIVIRNTEAQSHTILPVSRIATIEVDKRPYPGLLVVAAGVFVMAAAAAFSQEGDGAAIPMGLLGLFLVILYFASRRASVTFVLTSGARETVSGTLRDMSRLVAVMWESQPMWSQQLAKLQL